MADPSAAPLDLEAIRQRHAAGYPLSVHIEQAFQDATADVAALLTAYVECQNELKSALAELERLKANG
jgi:hypothetical protein